MSKGHDVVMYHNIINKLLVSLIVFLTMMPTAFSSNEIIAKPDELPELEEVNNILHINEKIEGIVFVIYEYDESALTFFMPRLLYYVSLIKRKHKTLQIAVVSHGDEMLALTIENIVFYLDVHNDLKKLVNNYDVSFHVCGRFAQMNDLDDLDFPPYVDVVPFGPEQINDYEALDFRRIDLELSF